MHEPDAQDDAEGRAATARSQLLLYAKDPVCRRLGHGRSYRTAECSVGRAVFFPRVDDRAMATGLEDGQEDIPNKEILSIRSLALRLASVDRSGCDASTVLVSKCV